MSANSDRIEQIRDNTKNDAETLAQLFTDTGISDNGTVAGRLRAILEATENFWVPGLQTGIEFHDSGFKQPFKDPWPDSNNQVGHFLTAVGLSFNPAKVQQQLLGQSLRDWLTAPAGMPDEHVALRLTIGHEKSPDPPLKILKPFAVLPLPGPQTLAVAASILAYYKKQFLSATQQDMNVFYDAYTLLGTASPLNLSAANAKLRGGISVDETKYGNSYADLLLSLYGWLLGQWIRAGAFATGAAVAAWVRDNIKA
jgi:hypothetical protein